MLPMIIRTNIIAPDVIIQFSTWKTHHPSKWPKVNFLHWRRFIYQRSIDCTLRMASITSDLIGCPLVFDSWSCYNATPAGTMMWEFSPNKPILNFDIIKTSSKYCTDKGTWWVHPQSNRTWSNKIQSYFFWIFSLIPPLFFFWNH